MRALIIDDTHAMKTASPSAVNARLNPKARRMLKTAALPDIAWGINKRERMNEADIKAKASMFLIFGDIRPIKGRIREPMTGIKTMHRSTALYICVKIKAQLYQK